LHPLDAIFFFDRFRDYDYDRIVGKKASRLASGLGTYSGAIWAADKNDR
jgi:4-hydroxybenzoate polyprenyltransferase